MNDPNPQRWREAFQAHGAEAEALASPLSPEAFNRPPGKGAWSVGQCLDHLSTAGGLLAGRLRNALAKERREERRTEGERPHLRLRDRFFARMNGPEAWLAMPSPSAYRPAAGPLDPEDTVRAFQALQGDLIACVDAAEGLDWTAVMVASPASRLVRLSAGGWLEGTLAHQQRHLRQARAPRAALAP